PTGRRAPDGSVRDAGPRLAAVRRVLGEREVPAADHADVLRALRVGQLDRLRGRRLPAALPLRHGLQLLVVDAEQTGQHVVGAVLAGALQVAGRGVLRHADDRVDAAARPLPADPDDLALLGGDLRGLG